MIKRRSRISDFFFADVAFLISLLNIASAVASVQEALCGIATVNTSPHVAVCRVCASYRSNATRRRQGDVLSKMIRTRIGLIRRRFFGNGSQYCTQGKFFVSFASALRHPSIAGPNKTVYKFYLEVVTGQAGQGGAGFELSHACGVILNKAQGIIYVFDPNDTESFSGLVKGVQDFAKNLRRRMCAGASFELVKHEHGLNDDSVLCRRLSMEFLLRTPSYVMVV